MAKKARCKRKGCRVRFQQNRPHQLFCSTGCRFKAWDAANPRQPKEVARAAK